MSVKIQNIEGLTTAELQDEVAAGAKFVMYQYCISIIFITFRRPSDIYFIRSSENALTKGLQFSILSFFLGWWGLPWGPIYTIGSLITNFKGGKNITDSVFAELISHQPITAPAM